MKRFSSPGVVKSLDSLIENDMRFETSEKKLLRIVVFGTVLFVLWTVMFVLWAIYFIHVIQNYRLTPIILR